MIYTLTPNPAVDRELTVPVMEFDSVLRASESRIDFGGKGFNVSRLLKGMDASSVAVGFLAGNAGELLQNGLKSLGIGTDFVWVPGETRTNVSIVTQAHDHYIKANEKGPLVDAAKQQELLDKNDPPIPGHGHDHHDAAAMGPLDIFPIVFTDQVEILALMQDHIYLWDLKFQI